MRRLKQAAVQGAAAAHQLGSLLFLQEGCRAGEGGRSGTDKEAVQTKGQREKQPGHATQAQVASIPTSAGCPWTWRELPLRLRRPNQSDL